MKKRCGSVLRSLFDKHIRKAVLAVMLLGVMTAGFFAPACAATGAIDDITQVESDAWLLMDARSGQLLAAKNPDKQKFPASITKILTLALTLERCNLEETLTVSKTAVNVGYNTSHIALQPGEVITLRDAAMATLLASANDAANCLAEYVGGSVEGFALLMNEKLTELGCTGTHFTNPSGLPDENHYTTARDMAKITAWALTVPGFRELFGETFYTMPATNLQPEARSWGTQNAMYVNSAFYADGAWGGKLGWTEEARHTMVTTLTREGRDLILVTMDSQHKYQKYWDGLCILDYCTDRLQLVTLDDTAVEPAAAPMYSGDTLLGTVPYTVEALAVWAPVGTQPQQLRTGWTLPERLEVGDTTPALLTVTLPESSGWLLPEKSVSLPAAQGSLAEVQTAWRALQAQTDGTAAWQLLAEDARAQRRWRTVGTAILIPVVLVLLAFCVRWYNLARRNLRRYGSLFKPKKPDFRPAVMPPQRRDGYPYRSDAARRQALRNTPLRNADHGTRIHRR